MRKIFLILTILFWSSWSFAGGILKQSTATTINIGPFVKIADGSLESSATITGISVSFIKQSTALSSSVTTVSLAASGSDNDGVFVAKGTYNAEVSAGNSDTLGRLDVVATYANCYPVFDSFMIVATDSYASTVEGDLAELSDFFGYAAASVTDQNSIFYLVKNVDVPVSGIPTEVWGYSAAEVGVGAPSATPTFNDLMMNLYQYRVMRYDDSATEEAVYDSAGTKIWKRLKTSTGNVRTNSKAVTP